MTEADSSFGFELLAEDGDTHARRGLLHTAHGDVPTPVFMPVGTSGAVRCVKPDDLFETHILLGNTYHLALQPGVHVVRRAGGLHAFMGWDGPILTDSGGFQVFSLPKVEVTEDGVTFASRPGEAPTALSPEKSMEIQLALGSDILMAFDECIPYPSIPSRVREAMDRTLRWAVRCQETLAGRRPLFGIVQGGTNEDLRRESAQRTVEIGFPGYAIGGVSVGEGTQRMLGVVEATAPHLPSEKPRYLMGVGKPLEILEALARGVDMFDCVIPSRHGRGGVLYTRRGRLRIERRRYRLDMYPPDTSCPCPVCRTFTRAYIHHLFKIGEMLGKTLATIHNIAFYTGMMARARDAIGGGRFGAFLADFREEYEQGQNK
jgi:queuine tRNA-ribosyltransferase